MEQNNIKSTGMRTLTQDELTAVSGGFWPAILTFAAIVASAIAKGFIKPEHKSDND